MALSATGLIERNGERFANTELGSFCTSSSPVNLNAAGLGLNPWYHMAEFLPDALREYGPQWKRAMGTTAEEAFAALYEDPARVRQFAGLMNSYSIPEGAGIAERFDFSPFTCVMDVAGGPGGIAVEIGKRHPHMRGILMDLPPMCKMAEEHIRSNGVHGRFVTASADLLAGPYPSGADVITLGWILHDWSDERCRKILRNCFDALPSGGALLVIEAVLNNDFSGSKYAHALDLVMLVALESGARERSEAEYRDLLEQAGFRDMEVLRLAGPRDLVVGRKP